MTDVKRMTAKEDFLKMPLEDRNCEVELYEDCRTRKLFRHCKCVPWEMSSFQDGNSQNTNYLFLQHMEVCDPKGRDCIEKNSAETFNCSTTCVGMNADVWAEKTIEEEFDNEDSEVVKEADTRSKDKDEVLRRLAELEKKLARMEVGLKKVVAEGAVGQKGKKLDKAKYQKMIAEYRKSKLKKVKHFKFSSSGTSSAFGEYGYHKIITSKVTESFENMLFIR